MRGPGVLVSGANAILNGVNLWREGDAGTKVLFYEIDAETGEVAEEPTAEVKLWGQSLLPCWFYACFRRFCCCFAESCW